MEEQVYNPAELNERFTDYQNFSLGQVAHTQGKGTKKESILTVKGTDLLITCISGSAPKPGNCSHYHTKN